MTCQEKNGGIIENAAGLAITSVIMEMAAYSAGVVFWTGSFPSTGTSQRQRNSSDRLSSITDSQPYA